MGYFIIYTALVTGTLLALVNCQLSDAVLTIDSGGANHQLSESSNNRDSSQSINSTNKNFTMNHFNFSRDSLQTTGENHTDVLNNTTPFVNQMSADKNFPGGNVHNTTPHTIQEPKLEYLDFLPEQSSSSQPGSFLPVTDSDEGASRGRDGGMILWVCLLAIGCFICGALSSSIIATLLYRYQYRRWHYHNTVSNQRHHCHNSRSYHQQWHSHSERLCNHSVDVEYGASKTHHTTSPTPQPAEDIKKRFSIVFSKEDLSPKSVLQQQNNQYSPSTSEGLIPMVEKVPTYCTQESIESNCQGERSNSLTPLLSHFSGNLKTDTGGVNCMLSDVTVWTSTGEDTGPQIVSQQVMVSFSQDGKQCGLSLNPLEVQLSPVVHIHSPKLRNMANRVELNPNEVTHKADWKLCVKFSSSPVGPDMVWEEVPEVIESKHLPTGVVHWSWREGSVVVESKLYGSFVCVGLLKDSCINTVFRRYSNASQCNLYRNSSEQDSSSA